MSVGLARPSEVLSWLLSLAAWRKGIGSRQRAVWCGRCFRCPSTAQGVLGLEGRGWPGQMCEPTWQCSPGNYKE